MGTLYINWMFSFADSYVETDRKEDVQIETFCCIFKHRRVNWSSIIVTGISGIAITMPDIAYVSIWTMT